MKETLTFIILIISINLLGQQIAKDEYISISKAILSQPEIRDNLIEYAHFDSHPMFDRNCVFIIDTIRIDKEIIVNDNNPKFRITDFFDIWSGAVNYWLFPTEIILKKNKVKYSFETQSSWWQDSTNYIKGVIYLKKHDSKWVIQKTDISPYRFKEANEIECSDRVVECTTDFDRPRKSKTNNPFFGDWQCLYDSSYCEIYFSDDTLYYYQEIWGHGMYDLKYEITENEYIVYNPDGNHTRLQYHIINKNKISIYGNYESIWENDTTTIYVDYFLERIKRREYRYSEVKCWGINSKRYPCFIDSYDGLKYQKAFYNRMWQYKSEIRKKD